MSEPRSNMTITDRAGLEQWQRETTITELTRTAHSISGTMTALKMPPERDTADSVCAAAWLALSEARNRVDAVITALEDGRLTALTGMRATG